MVDASQSEGALHIGVDTGGTYTDAAIIKAGEGEVISSAKALTTRGDYAIGVSEAIKSAIDALGDSFNARDVKLVCVSTTLATNAVVEGHGDQAGVILVGFDDAMADKTGIAQAFPGMPVIRVAGGHDHNGAERQVLDEAAITEALNLHGDEVAAFAVASQFAVRNPAHENRVRDLITAITSKPVTLSGELSSALDAPRRALTAALNARLISRISDLINAVERSLQSFGISCPLMIVKGDGTLALAENVALRPIETILSGPAASMVGAARLSGLDNFIMSDMGGTTTDLGIMLQRRPRVADTGADVGGWRTMVKAIDVRTVGLGGDSEVGLALNGALSVGPGRVVPVSLAGHLYPEIMHRLEAHLADPASGSAAGTFVMLPMGRVLTDAQHAGLSAREKDVLASVGTVPQPINSIAASSSAQGTLRSLRRKGFVQVCAFTPSDAAHVLGLQDNWSRPAAMIAARLMLRSRGQSPKSDEAVAAFAADVVEEVVRMTGKVVLETALGPELGRQDSPLIDRVCRKAADTGLVNISIAPKIPVVAVGGPVRIYYQEVADRLSTTAVFPPNCDVANAVGAASGVVSRAVTCVVNGDGSGLFRVHGPDGTSQFENAQRAVAAAEEAAREHAGAEAIAMGAVQPEFKVNVVRQMLPDAVNENGLLEARVTVEAVGRPDTTVQS